VIERSTSFSASYACASTRWYAPQASPTPLGLNCGCQKRGWLGSFPTAMSFT
jgi:hypothetical protein